jgi:hypothetical protein
MAAILSLLGLYGGNRKTKLPLIHNTNIHTLEGHFGNFRRSTIGRMPGDRNLFSLDASFAIPTCVLRFEVSGSCCHTPVRPVLPIGQTSTHRSDRPSVVALWSSVLALWINQGTSGFVVKHWKPRGLGVTSRQSPLMTWPPRRLGSTLVLRLN